MILKSTFANIAKKRGWRVSRTFFYPPSVGPWENVGALIVGDISNTVHWSDARLLERPHVHINAYYLYPKTKKNAVAILSEIESLIKEFCLPKREG